MKKLSLLASIVAVAAIAAVPAKATSLEDIAAQLAKMEKTNSDRIGRLESENAELRKQIEKLNVQKKMRGESTPTVQAPTAQANVRTASVPTSIPKVITNPSLQSATNEQALAYMPTKALPVARVNDGLYVWADTSYQSIALPKFNLGWQGYTPGAGAMNVFSPRPTGAGFSGAVGYTFGGPSFLNFYNVRVEMGGSYVHATQNQTATNVPSFAGDPNFVVTQVFLLDGSTNGVPCVLCDTQSRLSTDYASWQLNMKFAGDWISGPLSLTPSVSVFGGTSRTNQNLEQLIGFSPDPPPGAPFGSVGAYYARSSVRWVDWGARSGLNAQIDLSRGFSTGLGGWIGLANRQISAEATDNSFFNGVLPQSSTIVATAAKTAFLANAEANVSYRPMLGVSLRGFVGLNYDDKVPGIQGPTNISPVGGNIPGGIRTEALTSWYAGGGAAIKFAP